MNVPACCRAWPAAGKAVMLILQTATSAVGTTRLSMAVTDAALPHHYASAVRKVDNGRE